MRKYIVCISTFFIVLCYIHMISSIAPFSIGEVTENTIYVNPHMDCIILVIPEKIVFAMVCMCIII